MIFNYLNIILEVTAHVFRAIGACALLLTIAYFLAFVALDMCNCLSVLLGLMAVASAILAAAAVYMELEQASEEVQAFRRWRAAIQNS